MTTAITHHGHPAIFIGFLPPAAGHRRRVSIYITCPSDCCRTIRDSQFSVVDEQLDRIDVVTTPSEGIRP